MKCPNNALKKIATGWNLTLNIFLKNKNYFFTTDPTSKIFNNKNGFQTAVLLLKKYKPNYIYFKICLQSIAFRTFLRFRQRTNNRFIGFCIQPLELFALPRSSSIPPTKKGKFLQSVSRSPNRCPSVPERPVEFAPADHLPRPRRSLYNICSSEK